MTKNMIPANNYLLVKPDGDFKTDIDGFFVHDFVDGHNSLSVTGEAVAVCKTLQFFGNKTRRAKTDTEFAQLQHWAQYGMDWDTDIEVKPGDKVLFKYLARMKPVVHEDFGAVLLVPYGMLYARLDADMPYPLNGYLFVEMSNDAAGWESGFDVKRPDRVKMTTGRVVAEGMKLRGYVDHPGDDDLGWPLLLGQDIVFAPYRAVRIEADEFSQYRSNNLPLYRIHRVNVLAYGTKEV